jgi:hypothetical protein
VAERDVCITLQMVITVRDERVEEVKPGLFDTSDLARALVRDLEGMSMGLLGDHIIDQYPCPRDGEPLDAE